MGMKLMNQKPNTVWMSLGVKDNAHQRWDALGFRKVKKLLEGWRGLEG